MGASRGLLHRSHYQKKPVLADDEELVEYRKPTSGAKIPVYVGEIVLGTHGERFPFGEKYVEDGWFNAGIGRGRYIIKKKDIRIGPRSKCDKCGESYVIGFLHEHYMNECKAKNTSKNQEVVMSEQKPLSYKRETLIDALKDAVTENEKKREEEKRKSLSDVADSIRQLTELMNKYPTFAVAMMERAASYMGTGSKVSVAGEEFKKAVEKKHDPIEVEFDAELKKLIRVYEKAEDETVEVHVHDTVYNYL